MWTEPKLCMGGVALPEKKTFPCEGMEFWVRLGAGLGMFTALLLISLTCYFWKKNKRWCLVFFSFISPVYVPNSLLSSSSYISTSLLPVAPSPFASLTHFLCFSFLSKTHSSLSLHRLLVNVQERHSPCFSYSNNCIACFLLGWSISTPGW